MALARHFNCALIAPTGAYRGELGTRSGEREGEGSHPPSYRGETVHRRWSHTSCVVLDYSKRPSSPALLAVSSAPGYTHTVVRESHLRSSSVSDSGGFFTADGSGMTLVS